MQDVGGLDYLPGVGGGGVGGESAEGRQDDTVRVQDVGGLDYLPGVAGCSGVRM